MRPAVFEIQAGASHQIAHRLRDQHFTWRSESSDAGTDVHCDSGKVVTHALAFPRV